MLRRAEASPPGCLVEVGVYRGGSAILLYDIALHQGRTLHLFDTFAGMPFADEGDTHPVGDFGGVDLMALRKAMPEAMFHVGTFPNTMPDDLKDIAFAHVDCDQYRSTLACIDRLWPLMVVNGVMWFDDFATVPAARRAVLERFSEEDLSPGLDGRVFMQRK